MTHPLTPREKVELKPCPFCGGGASMHDGMGEFWVRCDDCGASGAMRSRQDRAERDWNDRRTALASGSGDHAELARELRRADEYQPLGHGGWKAADALEALLAENAALRANEKAALKECSEWARKAGEAIGRLETSEAAGIVEGWQERATEAERKLAEAVQIMEPFARMADEEGGYREDDRLAWGLNRCDISWGDLRAVHTFLSKEAERG